MSNLAMTWGWAKRVGDPTAKYVLIYLSDRANHDSLNCFPSVGRIAWDTELSERSVKDKLKFLAGESIIRISDNPEDRRGNVYSLLISAEELAQLELTKFAPIQKDSAAKSKAYVTPETNSAPNSEAIEIGADCATIGADFAGIGANFVAPIDNPNNPDNPLSPTPLGAGEAEREKDSIEDQFQELIAAYPTSTATPFGRARRLWRELTAGDRAAALANVGAFLEARRAEGRTKPIGLDTWILDRRWEDAAEAQRLAAKRAPAPAEAAPTVFAAKASPEFAAWERFHRCYGKALPDFLIRRYPSGEGIMVPAEWPPIGRDAAPYPVGWVDHPKGSRQYAAWMARLRELRPSWTIVTLTMTVADGPVQALRVPYEWPPARHGAAEGRAVETVVADGGR